MGTFAVAQKDPSLTTTESFNYITIMRISSGHSFMDLTQFVSIFITALNYLKHYFIFIMAHNLPILFRLNRY